MSRSLSIDSQIISVGDRQVETALSPAAAQLFSVDRLPVQALRASSVAFVKKDGETVFPEPKQTSIEHFC